jgi:hypothetical protein
LTWSYAQGYFVVDQLIDEIVGEVFLE